MKSFSTNLYHIVFTTFNHEKTLDKHGRTELYKFIWGFLEKKKCKLYRINCVEDHIHFATSINPTIAPDKLINEIKLATNDFIKNEEVFLKFTGWHAGYGLFTYHISEKENLIQLIKNQEEIHSKISFRTEFVRLLQEHGVEYNDEDLI